MREPVKRVTHLLVQPIITWLVVVVFLQERARLVLDVPSIRSELVVPKHSLKVLVNLVGLQSTKIPTPMRHANPALVARQDNTIQLVRHALLLKAASFRHRQRTEAKFTVLCLRRQRPVQRGRN